MGNKDGRNGGMREIKAGDMLGGYRVVRPLGGGMGRVYEAEHEALGVRRGYVMQAKSRIDARVRAVEALYGE